MIPSNETNGQPGRATRSVSSAPQQRDTPIVPEADVMDTLSSASTITGMTQQFLRQEIAAGRLIGYKLGGGHTGRIRIKRSDLLAWVEARRISTEA